MRCGRSETDQAQSKTQNESSFASIRRNDLSLSMLRTHWPMLNLALCPFCVHLRRLRTPSPLKAVNLLRLRKTAVASVGLLARRSAGRPKGRRQFLICSHLRAAQNSGREGVGLASVIKRGAMSQIGRTIIHNAARH
jgi:hypothetical protein